MPMEDSTQAKYIIKSWYLREEAKLPTQMDHLTKDNGRMDNSMDKGRTYGLMDLLMKVPISMVRSMGSANTYILQGKFIKANGFKACNMEEEVYLTKREMQLRKEYGDKEDILHLNKFEL